MTISNVSLPCDAALLEATRRLFQRLFERLASLLADVPNANERANASVKALEILRLERRFFPAAPLDLAASDADDWRRRVETALEALSREISTVESRSERAYLRRLALDAALALNACDETFFAERFADALLAEIDDAEERQNALVAYSTRLADRIYRFRQSDAPERVKAFALADEIEDLRLFEKTASDVAAAVLFDATRRDATSLDALRRDATPRDATFADDATLDLTPFGEDVAAVWEQLESPGGFLEFCERASAKFFDAQAPTSSTPSTPSTAPTPQEIALRQALNAETRRRLQALLAALDAGVAIDGSPLDDDVRDEMQNVVDKAVIESPFALVNGEFFRAFLERSRNLDAFFPIFKRLDEAQNASTLPPDVPPTSNVLDERDASSLLNRRSLYPLSTTECDEEKTRWLESARRVAASDSVSCPKLEHLATYAEIEFRFGDKNNGKNAVRETLGRLPRLESPFERARYYRRLVAAHLAASYPKAAQKLASLWKTELDAIEPEDLRDAARVEAFELYSQAVKLDAALLSAFVDSLASPLARLDVETRLQLTPLCSQPLTLNVIQEIANIVDSSVSALATLDETAPDEAVFTLVKIATVVADALSRCPRSAT